MFNFCFIYESSNNFSKQVLSDIVDLVRYRVNSAEKIKYNNILINF